MCVFVQFETVATLYGEEPSKTPPEDFFIIFDNFLESFGQAKRDLENMKRKEEEEVRKRRELEVRSYHKLNLVLGRSFSISK